MRTEHSSELKAVASRRQEPGSWDSNSPGSVKKKVYPGNSSKLRSSAENGNQDRRGPGSWLVMSKGSA